MLNFSLALQIFNEQSHKKQMRWKYIEMPSLTEEGLRGDVTKKASSSN